MAKRIQDFRKFNSSMEEKTISNKKISVGAGPVSAHKNTRTGHMSSNLKNKKVGEDCNIDPKKNVHKNMKPSSVKSDKKEKNKSNKFITVFFILLIIVGITVGCLFSPTFNLSGIIVDNGTNITKEEILNSFDVVMGTNVFKVDYKSIENSIKELPYIQSVSANLEIPSEIKIEYVERKPFALVKYLESYLVMDKYGYILEISREKKFEKLPIIYNIEFESYEIGKQLTDTAKTKYDNVVYLLENASKNNFSYSISEINYESISNVKMWVAEEDVEIIYGEIDRNLIMDKLNYISEILNKVSGKGGRLDVSSSDYLEKTVFTERF